MIDNTELTEEERIAIKFIVLEKQKKKLEEEIDELKSENLGLRKGASLKSLEDYFKD